MKFLGKHQYFLLLSSMSIATCVNGSVPMWAEGACDGSSTHEGATRDYFNRGVHSHWQNFMGDWQDESGVSQGLNAYSQIYIPDLDVEQEITTDITSLVSQWINHGIPNQGILLRRTAQSAGSATLHSRESSGSKFAQLHISTSSGQFNIPVSSDAALSESTYKCLGNLETLSSTGSILMHFPLEQVTGEVYFAELKVYTTEKQYGGDTTLNVFRASPTYNSYSFTTPEESISKDYPNDYLIQNDPRVYLASNFESSNWGNVWSFGQDRGTLSRVNQNAAENFVSLQGKALQVHLPKGDLTALNLNYLFKDKGFEEPNSVYFRYYLRFGESWDTIEGGKLPGIAGTYEGTDHAGGWGGRTSNGTNGWSARGHFKTVLRENNPHTGKVPVGTYLYHADMPGYYGDSLIWNGDEAGAFEKNRWYAIEQYIRLNTPGENDGELRVWVDGKPAFALESLKFRELDYGHIKIDRIWMNIYHGGTTPIDKDIYAYIDNIVIASEYIGPANFDPNAPLPEPESNSPPVIHNPLPGSNSLSVEIGKQVTLSADITDPESDSYSISWYADGTLLEATGNSLQINVPLGEEQRTVRYSIVATDALGMSSSHSWDITITSSQYTKLEVLEDTYLDASTYKAMGSLPYIKSSGPMYLRFPADTNIDSTEITFAKLVLFDEAQYGDLQLNLFQGDASWFEGSHNLAGATREYRDYSSRAPWLNYFGDWYDANGLKNGDAPYNTYHLIDDDTPRFVELDVTEFVKSNWNSGQLNLVLTSNGENHRFISKEDTLNNLHPAIFISTNTPNDSGNNDDDNGSGGSSGDVPGDEDNPRAVTPVINAITHTSLEVSLPENETTILRANISTADNGDVTLVWFNRGLPIAADSPALTIQGKSTPETYTLAAFAEKGGYASITWVAKPENSTGSGDNGSDLGEDEQNGGGNPPPVTAATLQQAAETLNPGEWAQLETSNFNHDLMQVQTSEGRSYHIAGWTDDGMWDPVSKSFFYLGYRKESKFISYESEADVWRTLDVEDWPQDTDFGHIYGNNALDANNRMFYHHPSDSRRVYGYSLETNSWQSLPELPVPSGDLGTSIEYFPELDGLFRFSRNSLLYLENGANHWIEMGPLDVVGYHALMRYNPIQKEIIFMGGNYSKTVVNRMDRFGNIERLTDAPFEIGIGQHQLLVHPESGHYLIFTKEALWSFDSTNNQFAEVQNYNPPFSKYEKPVPVTIYESGVILFVDRQVLLYKPPTIQ